MNSVVGTLYYYATYTIYYKYMYEYYVCYCNQFLFLSPYILQSKANRYGNVAAAIKLY